MTDMPPQPYHYAVIARALNIIDAEGPALTLDSLAQKMNMSSAHFQRLFSQALCRTPSSGSQMHTVRSSTHAGRIFGAISKTRPPQKNCSDTLSAVR